MFIHDELYSNAKPKNQERDAFPKQTLNWRHFPSQKYSNNGENPSTM